MSDISSVGNQHGYLCPVCKKGFSLYIVAEVTAALTADGCDTCSDTEWSSESRAWCGCGWGGIVAGLEQAENFDDTDGSGDDDA